MINSTIGNGSPRRWTRLVAGIAHIGASDVARGFAGRRGSVVTTGAGSNDLRMIYCVVGNRCPGRREPFMTAVAEIRTVYVCTILTAGTDTIVTGYTLVWGKR